MTMITPLLERISEAHVEAMKEEHRKSSDEGGAQIEDQTMKGGKSSGATRKADTKLAVKKTAAKGKAAKDPNKPKRPASAFFVFMLAAVLRLSLPSCFTSISKV
uniref:Uncharacterized protein n=1 Tax=Lactuca sativa TaxID=4236 RepID=A0A9R1W9V6_LACSA|nr:hypothetical protein LSAT_V11C200063880 [Lactuca sativa]